MSLWHLSLLAGGLLIGAALWIALGGRHRTPAAAARIGAARPRSLPPPSSRGWRYLTAFGMGLVSMVSIWIGAIESLERFAPEHLPPPAIANQVSLDEKLLFLRRHPQMQPRILGTGSSSAMRTLDGAAFQQPGSGEVSFFNAGLGGGQIHRIRYAGNFFLELFPQVKTVVHVAVPPDFTDCSSTKAAFFNATDAGSFVRGRMSTAAAYLRYFNPQEILPEALQIAAERRNWTERANSRMYMDAYGTMPMQISAEAARERHQEIYKDTVPLDPRCLEELRLWSRDVAARGGRLYVVVPPISPLYFDGVPGARAYIEEFAAALRTALCVEPATLLDVRAVSLPLAAFADAYHLQWPAAQLFSREVARLVRQHAQPSARRVSGTPENGT